VLPNEATLAFRRNIQEAKGWNVGVAGDRGGNGVVGVEIGESDGPTPRTAPALPVLPELGRRTRSLSILSIEGVGELR